METVTMINKKHGITKTFNLQSYGDKKGFYSETFNDVFRQMKPCIQEGLSCNCSVASEHESYYKPVMTHDESISKLVFLELTDVMPLGIDIEESEVA